MDTTKITSLLAAALLFQSSYVAAENSAPPLPPRLTLSGTTGSNSFGEGDAMVPLLSNCSQSFYMDLNSKYGEDNTWLGSIGFGDRNLVQNNLILGGYIFGDYNKTNDDNNFPVLNPGIEIMSTGWDAHWNGYFPLGDQSKLVDVYTGEQLGIPNTTFFSGHSEYSSLFDLRENVGPGTDFEIGRTFYPLNRTRFFAGTYFFNPNHCAGIHGIEGGFQVPVYHQTVFAEFRDSYDNVNRNTAIVSLRINLWGMKKTCQPNIQDRMLDVISRHIANLYNGNGIPTTTKIMLTGRRTLVKDNIWFFLPSPNGIPSTIQGLQDGTFENPAFGLSQNQINAINSLAPNANFYINSGVYNNISIGNGFTFFNGQNIFGRMNNFSQPATDNNLPIINDTLFLNGNNNINNIAVNGNSIKLVESDNISTNFQAGIFVLSGATGTININNSQINVASSQYDLSAIVSASAVSTLSINNSQLTASSTDNPLSDTFVFGIYNDSNSPLTINNSAVNVNSINSINNDAIAVGILNNQSGLVSFNQSSLSLNLNNVALGFGIMNNASIDNSNVFNVNQSNISVLGGNVTSTLAGISNQGGTLNVNQTTVNTTLNNGGANVLGVESEGDGIVNINYTIINASSNNNFSNTTAGVSGSDNGVVNIDHSIINTVSNNDSGSMGVGVWTVDNGTANVTNTSINVSGNDGTLVGLLGDDPGTTINAANNTISINETLSAMGILTFSNGVLNNNGGNNCFFDGVPVPPPCF